MKPEGSLETPDQREAWDVLLIHGEVPSGKGSCHDHFLHGRDEEETPEQGKQIVQLRKVKIVMNKAVKGFILTCK